MPNTNPTYESPFVYPGKTPSVRPIEYSSKINNVANFNKSPKQILTSHSDTLKPSSASKEQKSHKSILIIRILSASIVLLLFTILILFFSKVFGEIYNNNQLLEYNKFLCPVVMQNPEPFNATNPPPNHLLLNASIWKAASEKDINNHNYDENGKILVTIQEAIQACSDLFGDTIKFDIDTMLSNESFYEYNKEREIFYVECISYDQCYIPNVSEIVEFGDLLILKVNYIKIEPPNAVPQKQMEYHLKKNINNNNFYIYEILRAYPEINTKGV